MADDATTQSALDQTTDPVLAALLEEAKAGMHEAMQTLIEWQARRPSAEASYSERIAYLEASNKILMETVTAFWRLNGLLLRSFGQNIIQQMRLNVLTMEAMNTTSELVAGLSAKK